MKKALAFYLIHYVCVGMPELCALRACTWLSLCLSVCLSRYISAFEFEWV